MCCVYFGEGFCARGFFGIYFLGLFDVWGFGLVGAGVRDQGSMVRDQGSMRGGSEIGPLCEGFLGSVSAIWAQFWAQFSRVTEGVI